MFEAKTAKFESGKEIKVKIPVNYHIKLHTLKVLKGQSISDTVEIALQKYFETHPWPEGALHAAIQREAPPVSPL